VVEYDDDGRRTVQHWHLHASHQERETTTVDGGAGTVTLGPK
jgi:hypothetical protein